MTEEITEKRLMTGRQLQAFIVLHLFSDVSQPYLDGWLSAKCAYNKWGYEGLTNHEVFTLVLSAYNDLRHSTKNGALQYPSGYIKEKADTLWSLLEVKK